jgi:hypothetical protein
MAQKTASAYDKVAAHLTELRDAHKQAGLDAGFQSLLAAFRDRHARRPAMMRRILGL